MVLHTNCIPKAGDIVGGNHLIPQADFNRESAWRKRARESLLILVRSLTFQLFCGQGVTQDIELSRIREVRKVSLIILMTLNMLQLEAAHNVMGRAHNGDDIRVVGVAPLGDKIAQDSSIADCTSAINILLEVAPNLTIRLGRKFFEVERKRG